MRGIISANHIDGVDVPVYVHTKNNTPILKCKHMFMSIYTRILKWTTRPFNVSSAAHIVLIMYIRTIKRFDVWPIGKEIISAWSLFKGWCFVIVSIVGQIWRQWGIFNDTVLMVSISCLMQSILAWTCHNVNFELIFLLVEPRSGCKTIAKRLRSGCETVGKQAGCLSVCVCLSVCWCLPVCVSVREDFKVAITLSISNTMLYNFIGG